MRGTNTAQRLVDLVSDWRARNEEWFPTPDFIESMHFVDEEASELVNAYRLRKNEAYVRRAKKELDIESEAGDLFCMLATAYLHIAGSATLPKLDRSTKHKESGIAHDVAIKVFIGELWCEIGRGIVLQESRDSDRRPLYEHFWPAFAILLNWPDIDIERAVVGTLTHWSDRVAANKPAAQVLSLAEAPGGQG